MKRLDFYFEQLVGESDMDQLQANAEESMNRIMTDQAYFGVTTGYSVVQHSPVPNLTVDVGGPGIAYDQLGRRVAMASSVTLNMSTDSNGSPTTVVTGGNEKWVSVFVQFTRVNSDQRFDGNGLPVLYVSDEGYQFIVTQGAEALSGTATRPALNTDAVLIADVKLSFGTTQILNSIIESADTITKPNSRFQYIFNLTASTPAKVRTGRLPVAMQFVLDQLNNHIAGVTGAHPATAISNTLTPPTISWANTLAGANLSDAIDGIMQDLDGDGANLLGTTVESITGLSPILPLNSFFGASIQNALGEIVDRFAVKEQVDESYAVIYQATNSGADYRALFRRPTPDNGGVRIYSHDTNGMSTTINHYWDSPSGTWKAGTTALSKESFRYGVLAPSIDNGGSQGGSSYGLVAHNPNTGPIGYTEANFFDSSLTGGFIFSVKSPFYSGNLIRVGCGGSSLDPVGFNFDVTPSGAAQRRYDCSILAVAEDATANNYHAQIPFPGSFGATGPTTYVVSPVATANVSATSLGFSTPRGAVITIARAAGASNLVGGIVFTP